MTIVPPVVAAVFPEVLGQPPYKNLRNSQNHSDQNGQFKQVFDTAMEDVRDGKISLTNPCKGCNYYNEEQDICLAFECNGDSCPELPCEKQLRRK